MAVDMFLKIDGIKGESKDSKHKDEIDVLAWSWGESNSGTMHMGGGGGGGMVNMQDFSFTKYVDKSSPDLFLNCAEGTHIKEATLTCRKAGGGQQEYLNYKLVDLLITSLSGGGSGGEDRLTENLTINFAKIEYTYKEQDEKGATKDTITKKYNLKEKVAY